MGEPEGLVIEAARIATVAARDLWRRAVPAPGDPAVRLATLRDRLEHLVTAVFGRPLPVVPADPPAPRTWLARLAHRSRRHLDDAAAVPSTDGERIRLPLVIGGPAVQVVRRYRLLALEQGARAARGTPALAGEPDGLVRDLALLAEAVAVDHALARALPGFVADLVEARGEALAGRPPLERLTPAEAAVERLVREALAAHPSHVPPPLSRPDSPEAALAWARGAARGLRAGTGGYRGLPVVMPWGRVLPPPPVAAAAGGTDDGPDAARPLRSSPLRRRPAARPAEAEEDDARPGTWMVRWDDGQESIEDPMGLVRPVDQSADADPEGLADSLADLDAVRVVRTPGRPREVLAGEDSPVRPGQAAPASQAAGGIAYPEWDHAQAAYRPAAAVVRLLPPAEGDAAWADAVRARHGRLVRRLRRDFEVLRPQRVRVDRQVDGPEVDLAAYVTAFADARAGGIVEDRLYSAVRPARRDIAIVLLVDVSASTDGWVAGSRRIIDVEKEALLVIAEALDALGDRHAILAFSGEGPRRVSVRTVKGFAERRGPALDRRIAALEPERYTRAGAALRHATALLGREAARHRLLLLLSDGKPNDLDLYEGRYGVEDTRQAVAEARLLGIHVFCLTVDACAAAYVPHVFGRGAYALLRRPDRLPAVLADVVRRLVAA